MNMKTELKYYTAILDILEWKNRQKLMWTKKGEFSLTLRMNSIKTHMANNKSQTIGTLFSRIFIFLILIYIGYIVLTVSNAYQSNAPSKLLIRLLTFLLIYLYIQAFLGTKMYIRDILYSEKKRKIQIKLLKKQPVNERILLLESFSNYCQQKKKYFAVSVALLPIFIFAITLLIPVLSEQLKSVDFPVEHIFLSFLSMSISVSGISIFRQKSDIDKIENFASLLRSSVDESTNTTNARHDSTSK
ncbi:MAG: hypothetical protein ACR2PY_07295 [Salinispira sp.]